MKKRVVKVKKASQPARMKVKKNIEGSTIASDGINSPSFNNQTIMRVKKNRRAQASYSYACKERAEKEIRISQNKKDIKNRS